MKKWTLTIIGIMISGLVWAQFAGGTGTEGDPYQITTHTHLNYLRNYLGSTHADKYFIIMNDIDLTLYLSAGGEGYTAWGEAGWLPIGGPTSAEYFRGHLNGNGKKITGFEIDRSSSDYIGLFGYCYEATIENLGLIIDSEGQVNGKYQVGALVGKLDATTIDNCYAEGVVNGILNIGGLIGDLSGSGSVVTNSHTNVTVVGSDNNIGGLIGVTESIGSTISNCYTTGDVTGTGNSHVGGLVGYNNYSNVSNSYSTGEIIGNYTYGTSCVGGLIGTNQYGSIEDCHSIGNVSGSGGSIGGLIGENDRGNLSNDYATGIVSGGAGVGGLIGKNYSSTSTSDKIITGCYATGNVSGAQRAGGLIGYQYSSGNKIFLRNCYSTGNVTRSEGTYETFGGFIGNNCFEYSASPGVIEYCYSTGKVFSSSGIIWNEGGSKNKGFTGLSEGSYITYSSNFFDSEMSEQTSGVDATAKTTDEMKLIITFTNAGWDFDLIWNIGQRSLGFYSYPYLLDNQQSPVPGLAEIFSGGTGEQNDPWQITDAEQLNEVRYFVGDAHSNKYFKLINDIDLTSYLTSYKGYNSGAFWLPIGYDPNKFKGNFNGNKFKVTGLKINRPEENYIGLFGFIGSGATVNNLGVEIVESTSVIGNDKVGGLAGQNDGSIQECYVGGTGQVTGNQLVGSLCGVNTGTVSETYTNTAVSAVLEGGGFAGKNTGTISDGFSTGAVARISGESGVIGGFCGLSDGSTIQHCYSSGSITYTDATDPDNKGFLGSASGSNTFTGNYFDMTSSGQINATQAVSTAATAKTSAQMKQQTTYSGWDFSGIWDILEGQIRPFLKWEWEGVNLDGMIPVRSMEYSSGTYTGSIDMDDDEIADVTVSFTPDAGAAVIELDYKYATNSNIESIQLLDNPDDLSAYYHFNFTDNSVLVNGLEFELEFPDVPENILYKQPGVAWLAVPSYSPVLGKRSASTSTNYAYTIDATALTLDEGGSGIIEFAAEKSGDVSLSVSLTDFNCLENNGSVLVSWQTASETNNARFLIYRNNEVIASIEGAGTTSELCSYEYLDLSVIPGMTYTYVLADVDYANHENKYQDMAVTISIPETNIPTEFALEANYPNPFNPVTTISYQLPEESKIGLSIFDMNGSLVTTLVNQLMPAGCYEVRWNASEYASGIYFYRLTAGDFVETKKMILLK